MSGFLKFQSVVKAQFAIMSRGNLFRADTERKEIWMHYIDAFEDGTDPMFRERTEHDCNCCKSFIRNAGAVVAIVDNKLVSVWDVTVGGIYQPVADSLAEYVKSKAIKSVFFNEFKEIGKDHSYENFMEDGQIKWSHFHCLVPERFVKESHETPSIVGKINEKRDLLHRSLKELTLDSIEVVLDLIAQNTILRGQEFESVVTAFKKVKVEYDALTNDTHKLYYTWEVMATVSEGLAHFKNSSIGALVEDLSGGMDLEAAVGRYEYKVGNRYKRTTTLITPKMTEKAEKRIVELDRLDSMHRRHATETDLTINNVLFADRTSNIMGNMFDDLRKNIKVNTQKLGKVDDVSIQDFINDILPKATSLELMLENKHSSNLMSLIAPQVPEAKGIFQWGNNFSWAYSGDLADSTTRNLVQKAGGNVTGVLRFSLRWNDELKDKSIDFDAHCHEPNGNHIDYHKQKQRQHSSAILDVDNTRPGNKIAVENITWSDIKQMLEGTYKFRVHNFSSRVSAAGFTAELEYDGVIYTFVYDKPLRGGEFVDVATINFKKSSGIEFVEQLKSTTATKEMWNITTNSFQKVSLVMNSPNHWDGEKTGNKHWFFIIDGCKNDERARGFFNEFLMTELREDRKVFEVLGAMMKVEDSDDQLSGVGFSSTKRNEVLCRVKGAFSRTVNIKF